MSLIVEKGGRSAVIPEGPAAKKGEGRVFQKGGREDVL